MEEEGLLLLLRIEKLPEFKVYLTFDIQDDGVGRGAKILADDGPDLALPPTSIAVFHADDFQAAGVIVAVDVPQAAALGEDALAQRVDVAVGRLPQTQDGLLGGRAEQRHVVAGRGGDATRSGRHG